MPLLAVPRDTGCGVHQHAERYSMDEKWTVSACRDWEGQQVAEAVCREDQFARCRAQVCHVDVCVFSKARVEIGVGIR